MTNPNDEEATAGSKGTLCYNQPPLRAVDYGMAQSTPTSCDSRFQNQPPLPMAVISYNPQDQPNASTPTDVYTSSGPVQNYQEPSYNTQGRQEPHYPQPNLALQSRNNCREEFQQASMVLKKSPSLLTSPMAAKVSTQVTSDGEENQVCVNDLL